MKRKVITIDVGIMSRKEAEEVLQKVQQKLDEIVRWRDNTPIEPSFRGEIT
jgi:hypothetical protein